MSSLQLIIATIYGCLASFALCEFVCMQIEKEFDNEIENPLN